MRLFAPLAAFALPALLVAAPIPKDKEKVKDEDAILGTWAIDKFDNGGGPGGPSAEDIAKIRFIFKKDGKLTLTGGPNGEEKETEYKVDPAAKVKAIDLIMDGRTAQGIYELDGDTLKLCVTEGDKAGRPEEFKPDGKLTAVVTFRRVKDEKKDK
jgi:uncharacterized protein (TIGR03067 family)